MLSYEAERRSRPSEILARAPPQLLPESRAARLSLHCETASGVACCSTTSGEPARPNVVDRHHSAQTPTAQYRDRYRRSLSARCGVRFGHTTLVLDGTTRMCRLDFARCSEVLTRGRRPESVRLRAPQA